VPGEETGARTAGPATVQAVCLSCAHQALRRCLWRSCGRQGTLCRLFCRAHGRSLTPPSACAQVPNLVADVGLNSMAALQQLTAEEGLAGAVKLGFAGLLSLGARV